MKKARDANNNILFEFKITPNEPYFDKNGDFTVRHKSDERVILYKSKEKQNFNSWIEELIKNKNTLKNTLFSKMNFANVNFENADFTNTDFSFCNFHLANLKNVDFTDANFHFCTFENADFSNVNFTNAHFHFPNFYNSKFYDDKVSSSNLLNYISKISHNPNLEKSSCWIGTKYNDLYKTVDFDGFIYTNLSDSISINNIQDKYTYSFKEAIKATLLLQK